MSIGVSFIIGMVTGAVVMALEESKNVKDAKDEGYEMGFRNGRVWKLRQIVEAERRLDKIQSEVEAIRDANKSQM